MPHEKYSLHLLYVCLLYATITDLRHIDKLCILHRCVYWAVRPEAVITLTVHSHLTWMGLTMHSHCVDHTFALGSDHASKVTHAFATSLTMLWRLPMHSVTLSTDYSHVFNVICRKEGWPGTRSHMTEGQENLCVSEPKVIRFMSTPVHQGSEVRL